MFKLDHFELNITNSLPHARSTMHGTRKSKTSVRGSTTDLVSANDGNIAPGLGAVSTSNIIAGGRTRKGAKG